MTQSCEENRARLWNMLDPDVNFIFRADNAVLAYSGDDTPEYIGVMWSVEHSNLAAKLTLKPQYIDLWEKHTLDRDTLLARPTKAYIANRDLIWPAVDPKWKWLAMDGDKSVYLYTAQPVWNSDASAWEYPAAATSDTAMMNVTDVFIDIWPLSQSPETSLLSREIWENEQQKKQDAPEGCQPEVCPPEEDNPRAN